MTRPGGEPEPLLLALVSEAAREEQKYNEILGFYARSAELLP
jgi:hypothetical protein